MRKLIIALMLLLPMLFVATIAPASPELYMKIAPTVWTVESRYGSEPLEVWGSAIAISPDGYLLTAEHVASAVEYRDEFFVRDFATRSLHEARIVYHSEFADFALMKVDVANKIPYSDFELDYEIGDTIYHCGHPHGLTWSFAKGLISGTRTGRLSERRTIPAGFKYIQIDAFAAGGSSGGGIFNENGDLLAVLIVGRRDSDNCNFGITSYLMEYIIEYQITIDELRTGSKLTSFGPETNGVLEPDDEPV